MNYERTFENLTLAILMKILLADINLLTCTDLEVVA